MFNVQDLMDIVNDKGYSVERWKLEDALATLKAERVALEECLNNRKIQHQKYLAYQSEDEAKGDTSVYWRNLAASLTPHIDTIYKKWLKAGVDLTMLENYFADLKRRIEADRAKRQAESEASTAKV